MHVKQSTLTLANLGLFCARHFTKGSVLGYYVGYTLYLGKEEGGTAPTKQEIEEAGMEESAYTISVRDRMGRCRIIDPDPEKPSEDCAVATKAKKGSDCTMW